MLGFQNYVCATNYLCFSLSAEQPLKGHPCICAVEWKRRMSCLWRGEDEREVHWVEKDMGELCSARGAGSQPFPCSSSLELLFFPGVCVPSLAGVTTSLLLPLARSFYFLLSALGLAELSWPEESETWESVRAGKCGSSSVFCFVLFCHYCKLSDFFL